MEEGEHCYWFNCIYSAEWHVVCQFPYPYRVTGVMRLCNSIQIPVKTPVHRLGVPSPPRPDFLRSPIQPASSNSTQHGAQPRNTRIPHEGNVKNPIRGTKVAEPAWGLGDDIPRILGRIQRKTENAKELGENLQHGSYHQGQDQERSQDGESRGSSRSCVALGLAALASGSLVMR